MNLLLVGGSGLVGTAVTPYLQQHHNLRVLDLNPPRHDDIEYIQGSITDPTRCAGPWTAWTGSSTMAMKAARADTIAIIPWTRSSTTTPSTAWAITCYC